MEHICSGLVRRRLPKIKMLHVAKRLARSQQKQIFDRWLTRCGWRRWNAGQECLPQCVSDRQMHETESVSIDVPGQTRCVGDRKPNRNACALRCASGCGCNGQRECLRAPRKGGRCKQCSKYE